LVVVGITTAPDFQLQTTSVFRLPALFLSFAPMGEIAAYILFFSIGIGTLYAYQQRRLRTKNIRISEQVYANCILKILARKKQGKHSDVIIRIMAKKPLGLLNAQLEIIDSKRNFHNFHFDRKDDRFALPKSIDAGKYYDLAIPYEVFLESLAEPGKKFKTFRFVVETDKGRKLKSHELTLNKKGHIFKPDSGRYN
jgi:hypothetical protein